MVGAGLAGLSTAWHLIDKGVKSVIIIDPKPPGHAEASSVAGKAKYAYLLWGYMLSQLTYINCNDRWITTSSNTQESPHMGGHRRL